METHDRLELHGLFVEPQSEPRRTILHIHGQFENAYQPRIADALARKAAEAGLGFVAANTRAQDYVSYFRRHKDDGTFEWYEQGGSYEIFRESLLDLNAWVSFARESATSVVLSGHSHGALKAAYYAAREEGGRSSAGLVLMSPSDDVGIQMQELGPRYGEALQFAEKLISAGRERGKMPTWAMSAQMSAATYLDMFSPSADLALFRFDSPEESRPEIRQVGLPTLVIFGENDKATSTRTSDEAIAISQQLMSSAQSLAGRSISSADHSYTDHEDELSAAVVEWVNAIQ